MPPKKKKNAPKPKPQNSEYDFIDEEDEEPKNIRILGDKYTNPFPRKTITPQMFTDFKAGQQNELIDTLKNNFEDEKNKVMDNDKFKKYIDNLDKEEIGDINVKSKNIFSISSAKDLNWIVLTRYDGIYNNYIQYPSQEEYIELMKNVINQTGKLEDIPKNITEELVKQSNRKIDTKKISLVFINFTDKSILGDLLKETKDKKITTTEPLQTTLKDLKIKLFYIAKGKDNSTQKKFTDEKKEGNKEEKQKVILQPTNLKDVFIEEVLGIWNNENHPYYWFSGKPRIKEREELKDRIPTNFKNIAIFYQGGYPRIIYEGDYGEYTNDNDKKNITDEKKNQIKESFINFIEKLDSKENKETVSYEKFIKKFFKRELLAPTDDDYEDLTRKLAEEAWEGVIKKETGEPLSKYLDNPIPKIADNPIPKLPVLTENDLGYYVNQIPKDEFQRSFLHEKWQNIDDYYPPEEKKPPKVKMPSYISLPSLGPKGSKAPGPFVSEKEEKIFLPTFDSTQKEENTNLSSNKQKQLDYDKKLYSILSGEPTEEERRIQRAKLIEKARQDKIAQEKAAQEKAAQEKAAQEKAAQEKDKVEKNKAGPVAPKK